MAQGTLLSSGDLTERAFLSVLLDLERQLQALRAKATPPAPPTAELAPRAR